MNSGLHHAAHAAHAAHATHTAWHTAAAFSFFLRVFSDHALGGQQKSGNTGCILQGKTGNFCRVDDACLEQIFILFRVGIEAECVFEIFYAG